MKYLKRVLPYCAANEGLLHSKQRCMSNLVRTSEWIYSSLYNPEHGYFSKVDVIASPPQGSIKFDNLLSRAEYHQAVAKVYANSAEGWSTPAELFQPVYSQSLARYLLQWLNFQRSTGNAKQSLRVYELGGGMGNNARHICDFLRATSPNVYKRLQYTVVEISPRLSQLQNHALREHATVAQSIVMDAMEMGIHAGLFCAEPCVVIALEVLDNLPHDKLVCLGGQGGPAGGQAGNSNSEGTRLYDAWVQRTDAEGADPRVPAVDGRPVLSEVYRPCADGPQTSTALQQGGLGQGLALKVAQLMELDLKTGQTPHEKTEGLQPALHKEGLLSRLGRRLGLGGLQSADARRMPQPPTGLIWARYIPTGAYRLLRSLRTALPRHDLLLADFTELPRPAVLSATVHADPQVACYAPGAGAPLTASKDTSTRRTVDHATYLSAKPGTADIFFPTDFRSLVKLVDATRAESAHGGARSPRVPGSAKADGQLGGAGRPTAKIQSQAAFLQTFAETGRTRTILGYNPLLEDYPNTAVLTTGSS